ncbi:MAG TPA: hypothetical protein VG942_08515 [Hyphomonadaceae bacterium]|nr:hypothetical protein [Hyphomonadaceae bacterium]
MPKREVDKRKTAKALRKLRRAADRATGEGGPGLTPWEKDFVEGVSKRLETYGSAFRDPGKGRLEEALSQRQAHVARVIDKKSRKGKPGDDDKDRKFQPKPGVGSGLKRKTPLRARPKPRIGPHIRHVEDDLPPTPEPPPLSPGEKRARLHVIPGGKQAEKPHRKDR